jgi:multicomponent Na+:H+ antiporter subunit D
MIEMEAIISSALSSGVYSPAWLFFLGAMILPLLGATSRALMLLFVPLASFLLLAPYVFGGASFDASLAEAAPQTIFGLEIRLLHLDELTRPFLTLFHFGAFLIALYGWKTLSSLEQSMSLAYAGAAIGSVCAGDLLSLFFFFECATLTSVFVIWAGGFDAYRAGLRYLFIHIAAGLSFLLGIVLFILSGTELDFSALAGGSLAALSLPGLLVLLALAVKCGFPLVHNWIQDSYPRASAGGTLVLSIFTTKLAIYALMRGFAGLDALIWIGAVMALFPLFLAALEDDLRRVLSYGITSQLGFMVAAIGLGTPLALAGASALACSAVISESLLFMALGAVKLRCGTTKASELGGLFSVMPLTGLFAMLGSASLVGVPLLTAFVAKGPILDSLAGAHYAAPWLMLTSAVLAELAAIAIRVPRLAFFGNHTTRARAWRLGEITEAPLSMLASMTLATLAAFGIGISPQLFAQLLPFRPDLHAYTPAHVFTQFQLLAFGTLAVLLVDEKWRLRAWRLSGPPLPFSFVQWDWTYKSMTPQLLQGLARLVHSGEDRLAHYGKQLGLFAAEFVRRHYGPYGLAARSFLTGGMVMWVAVLLTAILIAAYLG